MQATDRDLLRQLTFEAYPFVDQLPPRAIFETKGQYMVAKAIGNQQEMEYQDRRQEKLKEFEVPARFIADPRNLHPKSKAPQEYFVLFDVASVSPEGDHFFPESAIALKSHPSVCLPSSNLWPAATHVWKAWTPRDKSTGSANLPIKV